MEGDGRGWARLGMGIKEGPCHHELQVLCVRADPWLPLQEPGRHCLFTECNLSKLHVCNLFINICIYKYIYL